ncbi:MAG TPA: exodeoxyribonuclease VII small subunit [Candidatus Kapabacteria bacterium]|nr:exodeoxyribonuclease VII small subunit [Candidatus Kapabacteria bacterium]
MPRKETTPAVSFESEFERLAAIVDKLEAGNVPLAEMLTLYEEAMTLSAKLKDVLSEAELRVEKLAAVHEEMPIPEVNDLPESEDLF